MEASEHRYAGDHVRLHQPGVSVPTRDGVVMVRLDPGGPGGQSEMLTYGQVVALGGDFYGVPGEKPISDGSTTSDRERLFDEAFNTLWTADRGELHAILRLMEEEWEAVVVAHPASPEKAFADLGDSLSYAWNEVTGGAPASEGAYGLWRKPGRFIRLAIANMDHFGKDAEKAYLAGHAAACAMAPHDLNRAIAMNAFADHYLTDLFASGHIRTPRRLLNDTAWTGESALSRQTIGGLLSRAMHGEENRTGLHVASTRKPEGWVAYGDRVELEPKAAANLAEAIRAVQASFDDVLRSAQGVPPTFTALQYVPHVPGPYPPTHGPSIAPMFVDVRGVPELRGRWRDMGPGPTDVYSYVSRYFWGTTVAAVFGRDLLSDAERAFAKAFLGQ
ncbi:hypothetical protein [Isoptericola croceus]|uniref:hypothetical protein n=1 Tax=Isoptericola croceus TaxID=3031406 RepID=UPI0023F801CB|nr:hypothetical protein [Isoptericola croceus]